MKSHTVKGRIRRVIVLVAIVAIFGYLLLRPPELGTRESLNVLIVGINGVVTAETTPGAPLESAPTADTIALLSLHPKERTAHLLLFPGETPVQPDPNDPLAVYAPLQPLHRLVDGHGAPSLLAFIEDNLDVPVHHVIRIDSLSLIKLVDRVGGLPIRPAPVGAATMALPESDRVAGQGVVDYLQLGADAGGTPRLEAQQAVYQAALNVIRSQRRLVHLEDLFQFARRHLETDMPVEQLFAVAKHLYTIPDDRVRLEVLPGRFVDGAFELDREALESLVDRTYRNKERPSMRPEVLL